MPSLAGGILCFAKLTIGDNDMKKILIVLALLACSVFAGKPVKVEVCRPSFCYTYVLNDVRKAEYSVDLTGKRFVRVYFINGKILDITGDVKILKK